MKTDDIMSSCFVFFPNLNLSCNSRLRTSAQLSSARNVSHQQSSSPPQLPATPISSLVLKVTGDHLVVSYHFLYSSVFYYVYCRIVRFGFFGVLSLLLAFLAVTRFGLMEPEMENAKDCFITMVDCVRGAFFYSRFLCKGRY